ncbi:MAG: glutamate 5-kinase, partial [Acidimicrobiales bacterium]
MTAGTVVVKIGTSSVTAGGNVDAGAIGKLCGEVAGLKTDHHEVVIVTSGAIEAGLGRLAMAGRRPGDLATLQALSAVGQSRLMAVYDEQLSAAGLVSGQVLLTPLDLLHRRQYLTARQTLRRLLELGVVPVVNENDAVADDEIRFSDNDRLAALVAHLIGARLLVLLTDTAGLYDADPRIIPSASLVEEVAEIDHALQASAGGPGSASGSGGMASKLAACKIASWSGVRAVIAAASRPGVLASAVAGEPGVGTSVTPASRTLPARKLWIAFASPPSGRVLVDAGARAAIVSGAGSLLAAGVVGVVGDFGAEDTVELAEAEPPAGTRADDRDRQTGGVFAKGVARYSSGQIAAWAGRKASE